MLLPRAARVPHADALDLGQALDQQLGFLHRHRFGDFEFDALGRRAAGGDRLAQHVQEMRVAELDLRHVDGHCEVQMAGCAQARQLGACFAQHPGADVDDQAGVFGDRDETVGRDEAAVVQAPA
jgi:hypothetical protein